MTLNPTTRIPPYPPLTYDGVFVALKALGMGHYDPRGRPVDLVVHPDLLAVAVSIALSNTFSGIIAAVRVHLLNDHWRLEFARPQTRKGEWPCQWCDSSNESKRTQCLTCGGPNLASCHRNSIATSTATATQDPSVNRHFEFLDEEDNEIWNRLVVAKNLDPRTSFIRFWRSGNLQLDGAFSLEELQAFVEAMRQMAERATDEEPQRFATDEGPSQPHSNLETTSLSEETVAALNLDTDKEKFAAILTIMKDQEESLKGAPLWAPSKP